MKKIFEKDSIFQKKLCGKTIFQVFVVSLNLNIFGCEVPGALKNFKIKKTLMFLTGSSYKMKETVKVEEEKWRMNHRIVENGGTVKMREMGKL